MDRANPRSCVAAVALLSDLPSEALLEILARLPVKPLHRSKCVAKAWRDLIDDPLHRKKLPQTLEGFIFLTPKGMGEVGGGGEGWHLGFVNLAARERRVPLDIDPRFSFLTELPGIEKLYLKGSCNGFILFQNYRKSDEATYSATPCATPSPSDGGWCPPATARGTRFRV